MKTNGVTWKIFFLIVLNDFADSAAQLMMKKGLIQAPMDAGWADAARFVAANASSFLVWAGVLIYALNFLIWIVVLTRIDLSLAVPLASTNYLTLPFFAIFFLKENVTPLRWAGTLLVALGIHLLSKSAPAAVEEPCSKSFL